MCITCGTTTCSCTKKKICGCTDTVSCKCWYYEGETLPTTNILKDDIGCTILKKIDDTFTDVVESIGAILPPEPTVPMVLTTPSSEDGYVLFKNKTTGIAEWKPARLVTLIV